MVARLGVIAATLALLLGAVYAVAASMGVELSTLASGNAVVEAPEGVEVTSIVWRLDPKDYSKVKRVDVGFGPTETWCLDFYLALFDGEATLAWKRVAPLEVDGGLGGTIYYWNLSPSISAAAIDRFAITVTKATAGVCP